MTNGHVLPIWLDLTGEPVKVSAPDSAGPCTCWRCWTRGPTPSRSRGKRASGTGAGHFAVFPPSWQRELPAEVQRIDDAPDMCGSSAAPRQMAQADYEAAYRVQDGYTVTPLSRWDGNGIRRR
jgi:hypothetical protein